MHPIIKKIKLFQSVWKKLHSVHRLSVSGVWDSSKAALIASVTENIGMPCLVVTEDESEAERLYQDLSFFSSFKPIMFPAWETLPHEKVPPHIDIVADRFSCLEYLRRTQSTSFLVVTPIQALMHRVLSSEDLDKVTMLLSRGMKMALSGLIRFLDGMGYRRGIVVEEKGQIAVRGGILDIYSPQGEEPIRVEFEGDRISSLRKFDPQTQVSIEKVDEFQIFPAYELELYAGRNLVELGDYFLSDYILCLNDWDRIWSRIESIEVDISKAAIDDVKDYISLDRLKPAKTLYLGDLENGKIPKETPHLHLPIAKSSSWKSLEISLDSPLGYRSEIFSTLAEKTKDGFYTYLVSHRKAEGERWVEMMKEKGIWDPEAYSILEGELSSGFIIPDEKWAVLLDEDIFGKLRARPLRARKQRGIPLQEFTELRPGDLVIHLSYGIGRFLGVSYLNDRGVQGEYLTIEYASGSKLYVPIDQMDLVERYVGIKGRTFKLNRLGGRDWERAKKKALSAIQEFAVELLDLQAKRLALGGYPFRRDTSWQKDFEAAFIYTETPDQLRAIEEVKKDLESSKPMDRLICGDVGYGKTEVAIRAAFKVVMEGKQVAVLVPTTILAQQHYYTFRERFSGYPINVEMLSRFRTESEQSEILKTIKNGTLDVVIGTHRLLGSDVNFRDLGLVVVDEEQRFGVIHKEKFKRLRTHVDVLTLTATPIPRTLYLSMMQARDMSLIMTPPQDRLPVETKVTHDDKKLVRNAILREISRGGQVFYIHNRVKSIYRVRDRLKELIPEASFAVGHGQMPEDELEEVMRNFIEGKVQVLVSTNIVESGLDIPNANTIIIDHAEQFGLSDLYQLRGRVGRFRRRAYAYILYSLDAILNHEAKTRLKTIQDFTTLGAGFKVAMRDLEIRGAGNVLGKEQHGHVSAIGMQLYCRLLDETIQRLKGRRVREKGPVSLQLGFEGVIPPSYIAEPSLKMEVYHKIFSADSKQEFETVAQGLKDRFGPIPKEVRLLFEVAELKALARKSKVDSIQVLRDRIYFRYGEAIKKVEKVPTDFTPIALIRFLKRVLA